MKQAKILLSAIAIFAVVGGALAFKARTTLPFEFCNTSSICQKAFAQALSTQPQQAPWIEVVSATADADADGLPCTNIDHPCTATVYTLGE